MAEETWYEWWTKIYHEEKNWDNIVSEFARDLWEKVINLTPEKLRSLKVREHNIIPVMKAVVRKILEFYWVKLWELQSIKFVNRYWISREHFTILSEYWDIGIAYNNYIKQYIWEDIDNKWLNRDVSFIPKNQNVPIVDETQIMKKLRDQEIFNLEMMIKSEPDEKKKKLYQLQLDALNLKQEIDG